MAAGQMAEHVVRPHLGSGVKRIGQHLRQEQDSHHGWLPAEPAFSRQVRNAIGGKEYEDSIDR